MHIWPRHVRTRPATFPRPLSRKHKPRSTASRTTTRRRATRRPRAASGNSSARRRQASSRASRLSQGQRTRQRAVRPQCWSTPTAARRSAVSGSARPEAACGGPTTRSRRTRTGNSSVWETSTRLRSGRSPSILPTRKETRFTWGRARPTAARPDARPAWESTSRPTTARTGRSSTPPASAIPLIPAW